MFYQAETGLGIVIEGPFAKRGGGPAFCGMTGFAGGFKQSGVDGRFFMTGGTCRRQFRKLAICVTGNTERVRMLAFEREISCSMIEVSHPVKPIVTSKTIVSVILRVLRHKGGVVCGVAIATGLLVNPEIVSCVATFASQRGGVVVHLMPEQTERSDVMIKIL